MTVAELSRNADFLTRIAPVQPFVFRGYLPFYTIAEDWGATIDDLFTDTGSMANVQSVKENYLNDLLEQSSLAECIAQEGSFYFDEATQSIYIHVTHSINPLTSAVGYGYAFGFSRGKLVNVNGFPYLPLIVSTPAAGREARIAGSGKNVKATGAIVLANREIEDPVTRKPVGVIDFLLGESIYQNVLDLFDYNEENETMTPLSSWKVGQPSIGMETVRIELQDRRYR